MNELEALYGLIGLGLITLFIPYALQVWKMVTNWDNHKMLITSLVITYVIVDLYYFATKFAENPYPSISEGIFIFLGLLMYPLLVWAGTQGIYKKIISPA
jgi:hypothetical protein